MMPIPRWLQENSYRVLGLSANITATDAHKAASAMRKLTLLGVSDTSESDFPALGPVSRTESALRSAIGRLENPSHRIADRLFWFHSSADDSPVEVDPDHAREPLKKAGRDHDLSLRFLFSLYSNPTSIPDRSAWTDALRTWQISISSEDYWKFTYVIEQLGGFEPAANTDEIRLLRSNALLMAAEPLMMMARQAVVDGEEQAIEVAIEILNDLSDTGAWTAAARKDILAPFVASLLDKCRENREDLGKRIVRRDDAVAENTKLCDDLLRHFRTNVEPTFDNLKRFIARGSEEEVQAREAVASCLSDLATNFTWADRYIESEALFKDALLMAEGTLVAVQIERSLADAKNAADKQRLYEGLGSTALQALAEARRIGLEVLENGRSEIRRIPHEADHNRPLCQAMLAQFRSEVLPAMQAALAAMPPGHEGSNQLRAETALRLNSIATDFTWADEFGICLSLRQEALSIAINTNAVDSITHGITEASEGARQERMLRELIPLKNTPTLSTFNGIGGKLYGSSDHDASTGSFVTTYYFTLLYFPIFPLRRYRVIQEGRSYRFLGRLPLRKFDKWHLGIASAVVLLSIVYGMATSDSNAVQHSTSTQATASSKADASSIDRTRSLLKGQITTGRARIEELKLELEPVTDELKHLKSQIDELDMQLKALDDRKAAGEPLDVEDYNSKVNRYNDLISRRKTLYTAHKASFDEYEELSKADDQTRGQIQCTPEVRSHRHARLNLDRSIYIRFKLLFARV